MRSWSARRTLSIKPTRPCASIAARNSSAMLSSFSRFHGSASVVLLANNWVFDSINVSMIFSRFARSDEPVSVTSTIASASIGGLTSVAPGELDLHLHALVGEVLLGSPDQLGGDGLALEV